MSAMTRPKVRLRASAPQAWPAWLTCAQVTELMASWDEASVARRCASGAIPARRETDGTWRIAAAAMRELLPPSRRALWPRVDEQPSDRLPDGTPYYGRLGHMAHDPDEDKVQCHLCGAWLRAVGGSHLSRVHGWTVREYRDAFRLLQKDATVTETTSGLYRQNAKLRLATGELKPTPKEGGARRGTRPVSSRCPAGARSPSCAQIWPASCTRPATATSTLSAWPPGRPNGCGGAARAAPMSGSGTSVGERRAPAAPPAGVSAPSLRPWPAARLPANRWQSCVPASPPSFTRPETASSMPPRSVLGQRARSGGSVLPAPTNGRRRHRVVTVAAPAARAAPVDASTALPSPRPGPISPPSSATSTPRPSAPAHIAASGGAAHTAATNGSSRPQDAAHTLTVAAAAPAAPAPRSPPNSSPATHAAGCYRPTTQPSAAQPQPARSPRRPEPALPPRSRLARGRASERSFRASEPRKPAGSDAPLSS